MQLGPNQQNYRTTFYIQPLSFGKEFAESQGFDTKQINKKSIRIHLAWHLRFPTQLINI